MPGNLRPDRLSSRLESNNSKRKSSMAPLTHLAAIAAALTPALAGQSTKYVKHADFDDTNWQNYIRSPSNDVVTPKSILSGHTTGDISNPNGLLDGSAVTVFTRNGDSDPVPSLVVDFGQNVVGYLSIDFAGSSNATASFPGLKLSFSETQQFLGDTSDFSRGDNGDTVCIGSLQAYEL